MPLRPWLTPAQLADVLESGKYEKGTESLCSYEPLADTTGTAYYCCLGVFAAEAGFSNDDMESFGSLWSGSGEDMFVNPDLYDEELDASRCGQFIESPPDWFLGAGVETRLIELNDNNLSWGPVIEYLRSIA